jgi:RNA polymerase sigma-70 factor (ECF subfamily)
MTAGRNERPQGWEASGRADWVRGLLARHEAPLLRYALRIAGDIESARDAVQETFLKLSGEDPASLDGHAAAWLYRVCRHRALDARRKDQRMESLNGHAESALAVETPSAHSVLAKHEDLETVRRLIASLSPREQEAIELKFQAGLSYREIGEVLDTSISNVGFIIHTALKKVRTALVEKES